MINITESSQITYFLAQAKEAFFSKDLERTEKYLTKALAIDPDDIQTLTELGKTYVTFGDDNKALSVYLKILRLTPNNFNAMNNLGGILRRLGKYEESVQILKSAFSVNENAIPIYYNLGQTYKAMGKLDEARICFEEVLAVNQEDVLARNHLGCIFAKQGSHKKALEQFKRALCVDENHPIIHFNAAKSYEALGNTEDAKKSYENALKKKPGWADAAKNYSALLYKENKITEAETILKQAVNLNDNDSDLHAMLGKVFQNLNKQTEALQEFNESLSLSSENLTAIDGKISILLDKNENEEAHELLIKMNSLIDDDEELSVQCAQHLIDIDRYQDAYSILENIYRKNPKNADALCLLGEFFLMKGEETKGNHYFEEALKLKPENVIYRFKAAKHLFNNKKYGTAEMQMRYYLTSNTNDDEAWIFLGILYTKLEDIENAVKVLRKAMELNASNPALLAAAIQLDKEYHDNNKVKALLNDILGSHKGSSDDLSDLMSSLEAYEKTLGNISTENDVEKNLKLLAKEDEEEKLPIDNFSLEPKYEEVPIDDTVKQIDDTDTDDNQINGTESEETPEIEELSEPEDLSGKEGLEEESDMLLPPADMIEDIKEDEDYLTIDFDEEDEDVKSDEDNFESLSLGNVEDVPIDPDCNTPKSRLEAQPLSKAVKDFREPEQVVDLQNPYPYPSTAGAASGNSRENSPQQKSSLPNYGNSMGGAGFGNQNPYPQNAGIPSAPQAFPQTPAYPQNNNPFQGGFPQSYGGQGQNGFYGTGTGGNYGHHASNDVNQSQKTAADKLDSRERNSIQGDAQKSVNKQNNSNGSNNTEPFNNKTSKKADNAETLGSDKSEKKSEPVQNSSPFAKTDSTQSASQKSTQDQNEPYETQNSKTSSSLQDPTEAELSEVNKTYETIKLNNEIHNALERLHEESRKDMDEASER